jgi:hypothetical protein
MPTRPEQQVAILDEDSWSKRGALSLTSAGANRLLGWPQVFLPALGPRGYRQSLFLETFPEPP